ncbi:winged helix DNA-binding domain-containing protein [Cohnella herbarum]|uniref:Winged helix DNA-binding domain-containing protein n=1 Tax=Cohnella herbarum TaxID=2728023 RepID=A0A7Z2ZNI8_9BACL|nr:winged helix DNA-binding domain-containing protein [Cohnella herbarum]QJD86134.1 winged helix DNA-binding domain-containing protein [Cohnella herbarum]
MSANPFQVEPGPVLSKRSLNRALLERQMLIQRKQMSALEAIEHLVGLQAQAPNPPYIGLWARLADFQQAELSKLIQSRQAVRIALMRSTIHLVSSRDCLALRPLLQPVLERGLRGSYGKHLTAIDQEALSAAGRALVEERPRTFQEISALLAEDERWRDLDPSAIANIVRTHIPLVQVPPRGLWGESGQAAHTSAETWLGTGLSVDCSVDSSIETIIERYLAAFGPATVQDMQAWSGLTKLNGVISLMRPRLRIFRDEHGKEVFDLPDAPLPDPDAPISAKFMAEFDNALLSHADRSRIISEDDRKRVFTINGIIRSTFLIDGFVQGMWKITKERDTATLVIDPFRPLSKKDKTELAAEGVNLLTFAAGEFAVHNIRINEPLS